MKAGRRIPERLSPAIPTLPTNSMDPIISTTSSRRSGRGSFPSPSLGADGTLRIAPIRELKTLRGKAKVLEHVTLDKIPDHGFGHHEQRIVTQLSGEAHEIRVTVAREESDRSRLGLRVFAHESDPELGVPIIVDPTTRTLRVGDVSAPFAVADLPEGEDLELRVFIDKYLVEVFANDRQGVVVADLEGWRRKQRGVALYAYGRSKTFEKIETWSLAPTTAGFYEAARNRIWEIDLQEPRCSGCQKRCCK